MIARFVGAGIVASTLALGSSVALAEGDAAHGQVVFNKCKACHAVDEAKNKVGPYLVGVFGRPAGTAEGFKYSPAMKDSGVTWDEQTIAEYLANPRGYIKGNRMAFVGMKNQQDIADVIAYLKQATTS
jgi:cytochrome c2